MTSNNNIPQGYKQTELGIIPEDWYATKIGSLGNIVGGGTPNTLDSSFWNGNIQWYTPAEIGNCKYIKASMRTITEKGLNHSSAKILPKGTILLTTRASIGQSAILKTQAATNQGFQSIIVNNECSNEFVYYLLKTKVREMINVSSGSTFLEISKQKLSTISVVIPPLAEQKAIATALSDVDALIAALDKKIAKKKLIKQGAMQQLLTGKKRLPGFTEEWVQVTFKKIYKYASEGGTPDTNNEIFYKYGDIPFVKIEDTEAKYIYKTLSHITKDGVMHSSAWLIPSNSVLFTNGATIGNVAINKIPVATKQGILGIIPNDWINVEFLYYLLSATCFQNEVKMRTSKGTFETIILKHMDEILLYIPNFKEEQQVIATVLSDMDKEISDLEAKRDKYRLIKQGMMQKLLTGQIRLK